MTTAPTPELTDEQVYKWASYIASKVALYSRENDRRKLTENLVAMDSETVKWAYVALGSSSSPALFSAFSSLIMMDAEKSLLCHARYWETYEYPVSVYVHHASIFKYLEDAPLTGSIEDMAPFVAKAHALCAISNMHPTHDTLEIIKGYDEKYAEHVAIFEQNGNRAVELVKFIGGRSEVTAADLTYHLNLHNSIMSGEL